MFENSHLFYYFGEHVLKFSRFLWNKNSSQVNTIEMMRTVISDATSYYITCCNDIESEMPYEFSVSTINPNMEDFEVCTLRKYLYMNEYSIFSELGEINIRHNGNILIPLYEGGDIDMRTKMFVYI